MFAGEVQGNVLRGQMVFVTSEVMGKSRCGDGGDVDFVEEVGSGPGPLRRKFQKCGDGLDDRRGWCLIQSFEDGSFVLWETGDGPFCGIGVARDGSGLGVGGWGLAALRA